MLAISMIKKMLDAGMSEEDIESINSQTIPQEPKEEPKEDPKLEEQPEQNPDPVHYLSESLFCSNKTE